MLSRVADCVFWMSRYIERAENAARFVDVNLNLTLDLGGTLANQWDPLIYTSGDHEQFYKRYGTANQKNAVAMLAFDEENPNSIVSCLKFARENARTIREIIAAPVWEELNKFYLLVKEAARNGRAGDNPFEFFNNVKRSGQLIVGIMEATMSRGEAWHFAQMGRLLERADKTSRIVDVKYYILLPSAADVGTPTDAIQWAALLKSASALEMYRKRHGRIIPTEVMEFLILNAEFPRALRFCLRGAEESLHAITGTAPTTYRNQAERRMGQLRSELDYAQIGDIIDRGLHEFIDSFQKNLNLVGEAIQTTFFAQQTVPLSTSNRHGATQ
ncbi:MAG TPA: alpha-E domain-containing protein [Pirellulales bacterium]|jgi:uncharacterized alpha-E superfamily protein|nr:alpha-E domain-containing protein [Pirellulales bacterium]